MMDSINHYKKYKKNKKEEKKKELASKRTEKINKQRKKPKMDIRVINKKRNTGLKLNAKERDYLYSKTRTILDIIFGKFIRLRDTKWKSCYCVTIWADWCSWLIYYWTKNSPKHITKNINACHWISCWFYSHRWDEKNVYAGCISCNKFHQESHKTQFSPAIIHMHWVERMEEQLRIRHKKKPTLEFMEALIVEYKEKVRLLEIKYWLIW